MRELGRSEKGKAGKKDIMLVSPHGRRWTQQVTGPAGHRGGQNPRPTRGKEGSPVAF